MYMLAILIVVVVINPITLDRIQQTRANTYVDLTLVGQSASIQPSSDIFVVEDTTGNDDGFDTMIDLMGNHDLHLYKSETLGDNQGPDGLIENDDVIIIKVNSQWAERGGTNTDLLKAIIQAIVDHPDIFIGEIIVADNGQAQYGSIWGEGGNLDWENNNAENTSQSAQDVVNLFSTSYKVSTYQWDNITLTEVSEYSNGNMTDGYVVNWTPNSNTGIMVSYPKFMSENGTYISFNEGIWNTTTSSYDSEKLKVINVPVLKTHGGFGVTACVKHYMGVPSDKLTNHTTHDSVGTGGMGTLMAQTRMPVLNILDAIWINANLKWETIGENIGPITLYEDATRVNVIMASTDPVALDYWASKNVLMQASQILGYGYPNLNKIDPDNTDSGSFGVWLDISMQEIQSAGYHATNNSEQMNVYIASLNQHVISASAGVGGSISPSGIVGVNHGDDQTFTITPDTGYHIADVLVNGSYSMGAVSSYTFTNVTANHTIAATFTQDQYTLTVNTVGSGSVAKSPNQATYVYGDMVQLTATADPGWAFTEWSGDLTGNTNPDNVIMDGDKTVNATFLRQYEIELYAGWNLIEIPLTPQNTSIPEIFQENLTKMDYIYGFDNQAKEYSNWFHGLQPQYQTLTQLECGRGYWIHISENFTATLTGSLGDKATLYTGWNLVGVNSTTPVTIEDYFAAELSTVKSIHSYNAAANTYDSWAKGVNPTTDLLYPGKGYWVEIG